MNSLADLLIRNGEIARKVAQLNVEVSQVYDQLQKMPRRSLLAVEQHSQSKFAGDRPEVSTDSFKCGLGPFNNALVAEVQREIYDLFLSALEQEIDAQAVRKGGV